MKHSWGGGCSFLFWWNKKWPYTVLVFRFFNTQKVLSEIVLEGRRGLPRRVTPQNNSARKLYLQFAATPNEGKHVIGLFHFKYGITTKDKLQTWQSVLAASLIVVLENLFYGLYIRLFSKYWEIFMQIDLLRFRRQSRPNMADSRDRNRAKPAQYQQYNFMILLGRTKDLSIPRVIDVARSIVMTSYRPIVYLPTSYRPTVYKRRQDFYM